MNNNTIEIYIYNILNSLIRTLESKDKIRKGRTEKGMEEKKEVSLNKEKEEGGEKE